MRPPKCSRPLKWPQSQNGVGFLRSGEATFFFRVLLCLPALFPSQCATSNDDPGDLYLLSSVQNRRLSSFLCAACKLRIPVSCLQSSQYRSAVSLSPAFSPLSTDQLSLCLHALREETRPTLKRGLMSLIVPPGSHALYTRYTPKRFSGTKTFVTCFFKKEKLTMV